MRYANRPGATARRGFTLIEILVVLAIIAVLVGLSTAAIMKTRVVQQTNNTITLVTKVDQAFQKQWLRVVETAKTEPLDPTSQTLAGFGSASYDDRRARVIHIKLALIREFPVSFAEITTPGPLGVNPSYARALATAQPRSWQDQSSACLYLALKESRRGGDSDPDTFLSSQEVTTPLPDGVKEIVDAWGQPVVLARFPGFAPTQANQLVNVVPATGDPVDPENTLANANWITWLNANPPILATFKQLFGYVPTTTAANLAPVIFSAGFPGKIPSPIYNFQVSKR